MSRARASLRRLRGALLPTAELTAVSARLDDIHTTLVAHQEHLAAFRQELDAVAIANTETLTYLQRALRDLEERLAAGLPHQTNG